MHPMMSFSPVYPPGWSRRQRRRVPPDTSQGGGAGGGRRVERQVSRRLSAAVRLPRWLPRGCDGRPVHRGGCPSRVGPSRPEHRRAVRGRCCGDLGRDRRPAPVHLRPGRGRHAGLVPRGRMRARSPAGPASPVRARPGLRVAAWRGVWGCLQTNRVPAARYRHPTTREDDQLTPDPGSDRGGRADPAPAVRRDRPPAGVGPSRRGPRPQHAGGRCGTTRFACTIVRWTRPRAGAGRAVRGIENPTGTSSLITGRPVPSPHNPTTRCRPRSLTAAQAPTTGHGATARLLTLNTSLTSG